MTPFTYKKLIKKKRLSSSMAPNVNTKLNAMFVIDVSLKVVDLKLKKEVPKKINQKWPCKLMLELEP
jgi:hypothetical protein